LSIGGWGGTEPPAASAPRDDTDAVRDNLAAGPSTLPRFSGATRALHWVNAIPFIFLLITGVLIYVPEIKAVHIGGHRLVPLLHVVAGIGFLAAVPLTVLVVRQRRAVLRDVQEALTPEPEDIAWVRYAVLALLGARLPEPPSGKYNAGQKLSSVFWIAATLGLMGTGAVLAVNYFSKRFLGAAFVEQVFPWHTVLALLTLPVLAMHLYLALVNRGTRPSLRGILTGRVDAAWARRHHSRWAGD
jgi:formate dehydrogenase subunit gamma